MKASEVIHSAALSWPGVTAGSHRFGGTEYRLGKRELGHVHGDYLIDIPFPKPVRNELIGAGLAEPHHVLPESGWISFHIKEPADVERPSACSDAPMMWRCVRSRARNHLVVSR